jgi:hypothetical protein
VSADQRARWEPTPAGDGRVRIGLAHVQQMRWAALTAAVSALAGGTGVLAGNVALVGAIALLAAGSVIYATYAGVELAPSTMTVIAPSLRRRTLWSRTVRWTTITDIRATGSGEIWIGLPGEPPLVLRAPRGRWLGHDPDFDEKLRLLEAWWHLNATAALRETTSTPYERVRAMLDRADDADAPAVALPRWMTDTGGFEPIPAEPQSQGRFPLVAAAGFVLIALGVGYLLIGAELVVGAIALLVLLRFGRDPGRPLALGAVLLLVVAAISTIVQDRDALVTLTFANRRTIAAEAGAVIGTFLVIAVIIFAITERSGDRASARSGRAGLDRLHLATLVAVLPAWIRAGVAYVVVALVGLAIRLVAAPDALSPAYQPLIDNLRLGTGYSLARPSGGTPAGDLPPLAPVLVAYSPLGARAALLAVSTLTVFGVGWVAHRRWGRAAGITAAGFAAILPALWREQLPVQLAALAVLAGVALAEPTEITTRRAALAGGVLGLAVLARPDAVVAVVVVAIWISRQAEGRRAPVAALGASTAVVLLPWVNFVWTESASPWLASSLPATLNDPLSVGRSASVITIAVSVVFVAAWIVAASTLWHQRGALIPFLALPIVTVALALSEPLARDPLTWSAPLVAVVLGRWGSQVIRDQLGPVLEVRYQDVVDWDVVLEDQQRRLGLVGPGPGDERTPLEPEPEEDRLFL